MSKVLTVSEQEPKQNLDNSETVKQMQEKVIKRNKTAS